MHLAIKIHVDGFCHNIIQMPILLSCQKLQFAWVIFELQNLFKYIRCHIRTAVLKVGKKESKKQILKDLVGREYINSSIC